MNYLEKATESKSFGINPGKYDLLVVGDAGRFEQDSTGAWSKTSEESFTMGTTKTGEPDPQFALTFQVLKDYQGGGQEGKEITEYFSLNNLQFKLPILGAALFGSATAYKQLLVDNIQSNNMNPESAEDVAAIIIALFTDQTFTGEYVARTYNTTEFKVNQYGVREEVPAKDPKTRIQLVWFAKDGGTPPQAIIEPQAPVQAPVQPAAPTISAPKKAPNNIIKPKANGLPNASALNDNALEVDEDAVLFED